jgi:molecular chaperone DnaK
MAPTPTVPRNDRPGLPPAQGKPLARTQIATRPEPVTAGPELGAAAPLLIDVTPLTLAVETVGGYVDGVIARNTPIPCSQTRQFTTSTDGQQTVVIKVCQGEEPAFSKNTALGHLELTGLRAARRGEVTIEVTFELDADGILAVRAKDVETARETAATMRLIGL